MDYEEVEDVEGAEDIVMDHIWLDTGDMVIPLPNELIPYLEKADLLGIA